MEKSNNSLHFSDLKGKKGYISLSSVLFYSMSFLILLAIPVTVVLVRSGQQQLTQASPDFKNVPEVSLSISPTTIKIGEKFKANITLADANWYGVYFIPAESDVTSAKVLLNNIKSRYQGGQYIHLIHQGTAPEEFDFALSASGYIAVVGYQQKNYLSDFQAGDIACAWDGNIYLYRDQVDILSEILHGERKANGEWAQLLNCSNSGPINITVQN